MDARTAAEIALKEVRAMFASQAIQDARVEEHERDSGRWKREIAR